MPELPDVLAYLTALKRTVGDQPLEGAQLRSAFLVRSPTPPLESAVGRRVVEFRRLGKRMIRYARSDVLAFLEASKVENQING